MEQKNNFDSQLQTYFTQIKNRIKQEHVGYIKNHTELRQILNDFMSSVLLEQPQNVYTYAQKYFSFFNHQKDQKTYRPLVISGCSGAGKGTIIAELLARYPNIFELSISYTTRAPRIGQVQGRHYYFVTVEEFKKQISRDVLAEFCEIHGNFYGTHKGKLRDVIERSKICILDIDLKGGQKIHENFDPCNYLFIDVPNMDELEKRLRKNGTHSEEEIPEVLKAAKEQIEMSKNLDYYGHIVNDKLELTTKEVIEKIKQLYPDVKLN